MEREAQERSTGIFATGAPGFGAALVLLVFLFCAGDAGDAAATEELSSVTVGATVHFRHYGFARMLDQFVPVETRSGAADGYEVKKIDDEKVIIVE